MQIIDRKLPFPAKIHSQILCDMEISLMMWLYSLISFYSIILINKDLKYIKEIGEPQWIKTINFADAK